MRVAKYNDAGPSGTTGECAPGKTGPRAATTGRCGTVLAGAVREQTAISAAPDAADTERVGDRFLAGTGTTTGEVHVTADHLADAQRGRRGCGQPGSDRPVTAVSGGDIAERFASSAAGVAGPTAASGDPRGPRMRYASAGTGAAVVALARCPGSDRASVSECGLRPAA